MSGYARIESIEALNELRIFLCNLAGKISSAIDEAEFEITNTLNWLRLEQMPFWQKELRIRGEKLAIAQQELKRKQSLEKSPVGAQQSCIDEKKALAIAQRRFDEAEEKLAKLKTLLPKLEKQGYECRGVLQSLANFVHIDIPNRRTQIDQMLGSLESYVNLAAPAAAVAPSDSAGRENHTQPAAFEMEQLCKTLRQKNSLRKITSRFPAGKPIFNFFKNFEADDKISAKIKEAGKTAPLFPENDKLVFAHSIENSISIYFERAESAADRNIKLYIGSTDSNAEETYSAYRIADFLKEYPAFKSIVALPEKWLVVLENNTVKAVFNADDKLI